MQTKNRYSLVVMSDSHGNLRAVEKALPLINGSDWFVYLGDGNRDIDKLQARITAEIVRVRGNCDLLPAWPAEAELTVGNTRFLVTHGNAYGVKSSTLSLAARARETGCAWALFGHTHRAQITDAGGVMLLNPGTASGGAPTCARITGDGETFFGEIVPL